MILTLDDLAAIQEAVRSEITNGHGALKAAVTQQPVWLQPPATWVAFDPHGYIALPAIGAQAIIVTFNVPRGFHGVIQRIANVFVGGGFQEGAGAVNWQILVNGAAFRNYELIVASLGSVAAPSTIAGIPIREGDLVQLVANNVAIVVAGQLVGGRLGGYLYPRDLEPEGTWL